MTRRSRYECDMNGLHFVLETKEKGMKGGADARRRIEMILRRNPLIKNNTPKGIKTTKMSLRISLKLYHN